MSVTSISQSLLGTSQANVASSQLANDYQSFIKLLVAQVQNQDPTAPMESTEFVSQLAQLTQVEQSVQVNSQMENLRLQLAINGALSQTAMIGREVTSLSNEVNLTETGTEFWYRLPSDAVSVEANLRDENGTIIKAFDQLPISGDSLHHVTWDGLSDYGMQTLPGTYRLEINALNDLGVKISTQNYSSGKVISVDYAEGESRLQLADGRSVASGDIIAAR